MPCAAEQPGPAPGETGKEYYLVIAVSGPAEVSISRPGEGEGAEAVTEIAPDAPRGGNVISDERTVLREAAETAEEPDGDAREIPVRTVTLKEGPDYNLRLEGTGEGTVSCTVTRKDPAGAEEERELHRFDRIPVTGKTVITGVISAKDQNTLIAHTKNGEELTVDAAYGSGKNSPGFTVNTQTVLAAGILLLVLIALPLLFRRRRETVILQKPILRRKG